MTVCSLWTRCIVKWQDYHDTWHTYGYNDCRMLECTFLAEEGEISLASAGPGNEQFTVNLTSRHKIREESGTARPRPPVTPWTGTRRRQGDDWRPSSPGSCSPSSLRSTLSAQGRV